MGQFSTKIDRPAIQIISPNHVLAAVFRAVNDFLNSRLKSRNVHSEIVFALSPNNSVSKIYLVVQKFYEPSSVPGLPAALRDVECISKPSLQ